MLLRWLALLLFGACKAASAPVQGPVVIELYTSQGCSSCPPADRWLASLAPGDEVAGRAVIPLAFHVDYWNDLGWEDPLSSEAWTERQVGYARRLEPRRGPYTPELVVGGGAHAVGSDRRAIERLVANAPPTSTLDAALQRDGARVVVTARFPGVAPAGVRVLAAVVADDVVTEIPRGENAGETLREDHVVRSLVALARQGEPPTWRAAMEADPAWRVVVLAVDDDGAIVAARALH